MRNHDELTLDKLSDAEREEVFDAFAPEEWMRVYGRGIVRRLPTMLDGDPRRIRMVYSLLFSLPGTPVLFYGEEIGMGENPARRAARRCARRCSGRTSPTAASPGPTPPEAASPPPTDGYAPEHVNVEAQMHDPDSLLAFIRDSRVRYRSSPEIGWGELDVLPTGQDAVLAHRITADVGRFVALHNFAPTPTVGAARARPGRARARCCPTCSPSTASTSTSAAASTCTSTPTGTAGSASSSPTTAGSTWSSRRRGSMTGRMP